MAAGTALGGAVGERLLDRALARLPRALAATVLPDGGHASRSPQAALELYFDLSTLDEALSQRGIAAPQEMMRALDRLASTVRFFTLADGRLAAFQGGEARSAAYVAAARAQDETGEREVPTVCNGYHRLEARSLQLMPPTLAGARVRSLERSSLRPAPGDRGPGRRQAADRGLRLVAGGLGADGASADRRGLHRLGFRSLLRRAAQPQPFAAQVLGPRLRDAYAIYQARPGMRRRAALWLEMSHDGWEGRFGLRHERRLYLDIEADELRGEDRLTPLAAKGGPDGRRFVPFIVRFHLHPQVSALIARDKKSVLLKAEGEETGWWLRNDALEVALEASIHHQDGLMRHGQQIVLRGQARLDAGAKVRWKLSSAAQDRSEAAKVDAEGVSA